MIIFWTLVGKTNIFNISNNRKWHIQQCNLNLKFKELKMFNNVNSRRCLVLYTESNYKCFLHVYIYIKRVVVASVIEIWSSDFGCRWMRIIIHWLLRSSIWIICCFGMSERPREYFCSCHLYLQVYVLNNFKKVKVRFYTECSGLRITVGYKWYSIPPIEYQTYLLWTGSDNG